MEPKDDERRTRAQLADMPLSFLGFALWRAWVSLTYADPQCPMPLRDLSGHASYDILLALFALAVALCARRLATLAGRRWPYAASALLLAFSSGANAAAAAWPHLAAPLLVPGTLAAALGSALLILLWCEIYGMLNAPRAAMYYSLSLIGGVVLTFILEGFTKPYLYGALVALPALSALLAHRSYRRHIPEEDRPTTTGRTLLPWKFFCVLALFELVEGFCEVQLGDGFSAVVGSHSTLATLAGGAVLFAYVYFLSDRMPLPILYRAPAVLTACGLLAVGLLGVGGGIAGSFCVSLGVTLFNAIVFLLLCDISKRFGVSALLLFGIEEALIAVRWVGCGVADALGGFGGFGQPAGVMAGVVAIAAIAALVLNTREIEGRWGIAFLGRRADDDTPQARLRRRCEEVAAKYQLTPRELEVMELLAQGGTLSGVARDLVIAEGTAKAHTRHIYEKLGINTRQELLDILRVEERS